LQLKHFINYLDAMLKDAFLKNKTPLAIRYRTTTQEMHKKTMSRIRPLPSFDNNYSLSSRKKNRLGGVF